jgi:predicted Zn-dependent protease
VRTLRTVILVLASSVIAACAIETAAPPRPAPKPAPTQGRSSASVNPAQVERLKRAMTALLSVMDNPVPLDRVKVGVVDDPHVNAGSAGGGAFIVTTGLLSKADDEKLLGVLAHEVAHDDLRHVAKQQALGTGINLGVLVLSQVFPGSEALTPIAGELLARGYSRREELEADRHAVELLRRLGQPKGVMINTLAWLIQTEGESRGGFFSTHPATGDRIEELRRL